MPARVSLNTAMRERDSAIVQRWDGIVSYCRLDAIRCEMQATGSGNVVRVDLHRSETRLSTGQLYGSRYGAHSRRREAIVHAPVMCHPGTTKRMRLVWCSPSSSVRWHVWLLTAFTSQPPRR